MNNQTIIAQARLEGSLATYNELEKEFQARDLLAKKSRFKGALDVIRQQRTVLALQAERESYDTSLLRKSPTSGNGNIRDFLGISVGAEA